MAVLLEKLLFRERLNLSLGFVPSVLMEDEPISPFWRVLKLIGPDVWAFGYPSTLFLLPYLIETRE